MNHRGTYTDSRSCRGGRFYTAPAAEPFDRRGLSFRLCTAGVLVWTFAVILSVMGWSFSVSCH